MTGVCSARNGDQARSLGADVVIDYATDDFVASGSTYDLVIDLVGNRSLRDLQGRVKPGGSLVLSGGGVPGSGRFVGAIGLLVRARLSKRRPGPVMYTPTAHPRPESLEDLAGQVARGVITPVIEKVFGLDQAAAALRHLESEHARAKVVVSRGVPPIAVGQGPGVGAVYPIPRAMPVSQDPVRAQDHPLAHHTM